MTDILILGATSPDVVTLIHSLNKQQPRYKILGYLEKDTALHGTEKFGYRVLGGDELLATAYRGACAVVNTYPSGTVHARITSGLLRQYGAERFPSLVHPSVEAEYAQLGCGNIVMAGATLGSYARLGSFNIVYHNSVIGHEVVVGDNCLFAGGAIVGARTVIGNRVLVGNGATVSINLSIADDTFIGVGSVVIRSVRKAQKLFGNPARKIDEA